MQRLGSIGRPMLQKLLDLLRDAEIHTVYGRGLDEMMKIFINAYGDMINQYMDQGWDGYLLTFMFNHLKGSPVSVQKQMYEEVERVYAKVLTRIVRKPRS